MDIDKASNEFMASMMMSTASELLVSMAGDADLGKPISVACIQGLSNMRQMAGRQFLPGINVESLEEKIRTVAVPGPLDPKMKNLDPKYVDSFFSYDQKPTNAAKGCLPLVLGLIGFGGVLAQFVSA